MDKNYFSVSSHLWESSTLQQAKLHSHHEYEIYMFLEGNCYYVVEGRRYDLTPGDVIIIRKHEMHRVFHTSVARYHSLVFFVYPEFFKENGCEEYEQAFLDYGKDNKIDSSTVFTSGLQDAIDRLKKYSANYKDNDSPVVKSTLIELLYIINGIKSFEKPIKTNQAIKNVINYLNKNFTGEVNLDLLADKFFISKFHLCRLFKQSTGLTVQEYIRRKRLTLAMELKNDGLTLTEAAEKAGFNDYTSFYRYYKKRYKTPPKEIK